MEELVWVLLAGLVIVLVMLGEFDRMIGLVMVTLFLSNARIAILTRAVMKGE